ASAAEIFLEEYPHYFTNMNAEGKGIFYDQYQIIHEGIRQVAMDSLPVKLTCRKELNPRNLDKLNMPKIILQRLRWGTSYFEDDLLDLAFKNEMNNYIRKALLYETAFNLKQKKESPSPFIKGIFWRFIIRPYIVFFKIVLEKCCS